MTNNELFEKINGIIQKEFKERQAAGRFNRKNNEKNDGIWIMATYRKGRRLLYKTSHLDNKNFVDNMDFGQLRKICVDAGGKFYVMEKQQKGIKPEEMFKKKEDLKK